MTALAAERPTDRLSGEPTPDLVAYRMKASTTIYKGSLVMLNASKLAVPGASTTACIAVGRAFETKTSSSTDAADYIQVEQGVFAWFKNGTVSYTDIGATAYILDDQTVTMTSTSNSAAGTIYDVSGAQVFVKTVL